MPVVCVPGKPALSAMGDKTSVVGKSPHLPEGDVSSVKLAVMSCANFPAGYFNVYGVSGGAG